MAANHEETYSSVIRGHHVYKENRTPLINEELTIDVQEDNLFDRHVVVVLKNGEIVGHMPRTISRFSWFFVRRGGFIKAIVTGRRKKRIGLEVPCDYIYSRP